MKPFTSLCAVAAPMLAENIDTDQIIPKQFLKVIARGNLGEALFLDARFDGDGRPRPEFILNQPAYCAAQILVTGANFGCGSSREHAVWALADFGIRCMIGPSFADIFSENCTNNGLLLVTLPDAQCRDLAQEADGGAFTVDLEGCRIVSPSGRVTPFTIDSQRREKLLTGADAISRTLRHDADLAVFEQNDLLHRPWLTQKDPV